MDLPPMLLGLGLNIYIQLAALYKVSSKGAPLPNLQVLDALCILPDLSDELLAEHLFLVEDLQSQDDGLN